MRSFKYYFAEADIRNKKEKTLCENIRRYGAVGSSPAMGYGIAEEPDELSRILSHAGVEQQAKAEDSTCDEIEQVDEGRIAEVDQIFQDIANGDMDIYELYQSTPADPVTKYAQDQLMDMYDEVAREYRLHPDDDFEEILDLVAQHIEQDYGHDSTQFDNE